MTSYIPLLPTISVRRGPCQDRFRIGPRAKLPARRTSAPNPATVNSYDAPGAAISPAPAANRAGRATRRAASSRPTSSRRSCPKPASRPRPNPQPTSRTQAQHTRAPVRRNLHLAASLWTTTRRSRTRSSRPLSSASGQPRPPGRAQARPEQRSPMRGGDARLSPLRRNRCRLPSGRPTDRGSRSMRAAFPPGYAKAWRCGDRCPVRSRDRARPSAPRRGRHRRSPSLRSAPT
jgi:hypothetical protein